jgi:uncharacterized protein YycO
MKKVTTALVCFLFAVTTVFAQAKQGKTTGRSTGTETVKLKKDGTPDKRYKAAKETSPLKKDGTKDMRFKKNKAKKN